MLKETSPPTEFKSEIEDQAVECPISFLFVDHSPGNHLEIFRRMAQSDAEIILLELVGTSQDVRSEVEDIINSAIKTKDVKDRSSITRNLTQSYRDLVWALAGSEKRLHFIDIASDMPEYGAIQRARAAKGTPDYERFFKESIIKREEVVEEQLRLHRAQNQNRKILAVLGAVHYSIADRLDNVSDTAYLKPELERDAWSRRHQFTNAT